MDWGLRWIGDLDGSGTWIDWGLGWAGNLGGLGAWMGWELGWVGDLGGSGTWMGWGPGWVGDLDGLGTWMGRRGIQMYLFQGGLPYLGGARGDLSLYRGVAESGVAGGAVMGAQNFVCLEFIFF